MTIAVFTPHFERFGINNRPDEQVTLPATDPALAELRDLFRERSSIADCEPLLKLERVLTQGASEFLLVCIADPRHREPRFGPGLNEYVLRTPITGTYSPIFVIPIDFEESVLRFGDESVPLSPAALSALLSARAEFRDPR